MTRDDILRMAREADIPFNKFGLVGCQNCEQDIDNNLERFAALIKDHLISEGYRKCAEGQRTTQYCGQLEAAVAAERDESIDLWKQKSETYMEIMDAIASDADKAHALLLWAETEMRYAGWGTRINDQHGRTDVYEAIVDYLYGNSNDIA